MRRNPTMVFAGSFWPAGTERGLADGFRSAGWAVQEVDSRDHGVNGGGRTALRIAARLLRREVSKAYQNKILETCRRLKPDVFMTVKGINISDELLPQLIDLGIHVVMYYPDYHFDHFGLSTNSFRGYSLFITTKTFQIEFLENMLGRDQVAYVPHGYVGALHRPILSAMQEQDYRVDLLYSGNHSAYKQAWLENALNKLETFQHSKNAPAEPTVEIIGNRWREHAAAGPLVRCRALGERIGVLYAEAIQSARINIAVHFGPHTSGWEDKVSTRTFEIPACKGFMLHIDNEEVREFFTPGEEIDVFSTPEELADKINFYLARPELRAGMIERAYKRTVPAYSYEAVAQRIQTIMAERLPLSKAP